MSSIWGEKLKISLFGESHGNGIGVVIDGLPAGVHLDEDLIKSEMKRRAPGNLPESTPRKEDDQYEILSGFFNGHTTGTPICAVIRNQNTKSKDYDELKKYPRPSHGDYTGYIKYKGKNDIRGGGHFSGRITAGIVFAGSIAKQILKEHNIEICAHLKRVYNVEDEYFSKENINRECFDRLNGMALPTIDETVAKKMSEAIMTARREGDSVGGMIETAVTGLPAGYGSPFFNSVESKLSQFIFSIPGVKGIEFGEGENSGFNVCGLKGSQTNDSFALENERVVTKTNNSGGINGGITNGMPVIFRTAMRPTPSIAKEQETVNLDTMEETSLVIEGRHDPCIAVRAIPVIESAAALCTLDILMLGGFIK